MKREILFKGKRVDNGEWVEGSLINRPEHYAENIKEYCAIVIFDKGSDSSYDAYLELEVLPETVCQFTGLTDKNGNKIFDKDRIKVECKHGFNSELLNEFKELNKLESINGIGLHFEGVVVMDIFRGLMFANEVNGYCEPMFTRHIDIKKMHSEIEIIGNIHD